MTDTQQASDEEIAAPEPLSTGFERVYAEIHGEPVAWHILNEERQVICWHQHKASAEKDVATYYAHRKVTVEPLYAHPDPAVERLQRELRLLREQQKEDFDRATSAEASLAKAREAIRIKDDTLRLVHGLIAEAAFDEQLLNTVDGIDERILASIAETGEPMPWEPARAILGDQPT